MIMMCNKKAIGDSPNNSCLHIDSLYTFIVSEPNSTFNPWSLQF